MRNFLAFTFLSFVCCSPVLTADPVNCPHPDAVYRVRDGEASCTSPSGSASASWSTKVTDRLHVSVSAAASAVTSGYGGYGPQNTAYVVSRYSSDLSFVITGGTGAGYYSPCLQGTADRRNGEMGAVFGGVSLPSVRPWADLCFIGSSQFQLPFVFGVPQTQRLDMYAIAGAFGTSYGSASASINGLMIRDASGQIVPNATVLVAPEPGLVIPVAVVLSIGSLRLMRRRGEG